MDAAVFKLEDVNFRYFLQRSFQLLAKFSAYNFKFSPLCELLNVVSDCTNV